jgi:8-oxo-dGTP diphosphatase
VRWRLRERRKDGVRSRARLSTPYCWNCGQRLDETPPTLCGACGQEHHLNPKPCGEAVVLREGRVLLVRRAKEPWRGWWDLPGGFCEGDEHPMHAAERELSEEVGLHARAIAYLGTWMDVYGSPAGNRLQDHTANSAYVMRLLTDELVLVPQADEVESAHWFPLTDLPSEIAFPGHLGKVLEVASAFVSDPASFGEPNDRSW